MKYRCGSLKQGKEVFYIFIYDDELHTQLYEIWKITINIVEDCSFILKLGQQQTKLLHFQTNGSRVVQGFANDNKFISVYYFFILFFLFFFNIILYNNNSFYQILDSGLILVIMH